MNKNRPLAYDLDHNPIDLAANEGIWEDPRRVVGSDQVGPWEVSTMFLVVDHSLDFQGPPVLYETMVFGPEDEELDGYQQRYTTRAAAQAGHATVVELVRSWTKDGGDPLA